MSGYEIKPAKWLSIDLKELWQYHELFIFMAWRDIKVKYKQTLLGLIWVIIQPLALMLIFSTLWIKVMKTGTGDLPYPLFAYSGLIFWNLFSSGISGASESMISNSNIIKKVYFPRIIIPASAIIVALFDFLMRFLVFILMVLYYGIDINYLNFLVLIPGSILFTLAASLGIGLFIASATVKYRDFRYVIPFFLQAFFFVSPVIFPLSLFHSETIRFILSLNPLAGAISLARAALTNSAVNLEMTGYSAAITLFFLIAGLIFFHKTESQYSDLL